MSHPASQSSEIFDRNIQRFLPVSTAYIPFSCVEETIKSNLTPTPIDPFFDEFLTDPTKTKLVMIAEVDRCAMAFIFSKDDEGIHALSFNPGPRNSLVHKGGAVLFRVFEKTGLLPDEFLNVVSNLGPLNTAESQRFCLLAVVGILYGKIWPSSDGKLYHDSMVLDSFNRAESQKLQEMIDEWMAQDDALSTYDSLLQNFAYERGGVAEELRSPLHDDDLETSARGLLNELNDERMATAEADGLSLLADFASVAPVASSVAPVADVRNDLDESIATFMAGIPSADAHPTSASLAQNGRGRVST